MQGSSVAGVITAVAGVLTAAALVISALALFVPILRKTKAIEAKVDGVHVIVNQQRTDAQNYQAALIATLRAADIAVPADQSLGAVTLPILPKSDLG